MRLLPGDILFDQHALWAGGVAERRRALEHISKGAPVGVDAQRLADAGRDVDIQILRIARDPVNRPVLAPETTGNDFDPCAIVIRYLWHVRARDILIPRRAHLLAGRQVAP